MQLVTGVQSCLFKLDYCADIINVACREKITPP
jgi:hypothetical protein